jgi:hypothetical protein
MFDDSQTEESVTADERAVSVAISHALTVAITTILLSGLLVGTGSFVETQETGVADEQINEIGHDIVTQVHSLDQLNASGDDVTGNVELQYPRRIVDSYRYEIRLIDGGSDLLTGQQGIIVDVNDLDRRQGFDIDDDTNIAVSSTDGPDVNVTLCPSNEITLEDC